MSFSLSNAPTYPPLPTLNEKITEAVAKVDACTEYYILSGFDHEVDGVSYHFSYDTSDQVNFSQMNSDAILSQTIGQMSEDQLKAIYGTNEDGTLNEDNLPVKLPTKWSTAWQGHRYIDGLDHAYTLNFDLVGYLTLSAAGAMHLKQYLASGWNRKNRLRSAKSVEELNQIINDLDLEKEYSVVKS